MSRFLVLDSGPLGLLTHPQRNAEVVRMVVTVPAQRASRDRSGDVYYELKRELLYAGKTFSVARLEAFVSTTPGRYLPLSDEALQLAAELWAKARQQGRSTSDVKDLDIDVILAAQALSFGPPHLTSWWRPAMPNTLRSSSPPRTGTRSFRNRGLWYQASGEPMEQRVKCRRRPGIANTGMGWNYGQS